MHKEKHIAIGRNRDELGLAYNLSYSVAGQLWYVLTQMCVLSALARFKGPEAVGEFGLAMAITTPVFMLANMGIRTGQATDVHGFFSFSEYAGLVLLTAAIAALTSIGIGYALSASHITFLIVLIFSITKAFEAISNLSYGAFQQAGRMDKVARSLAIRGLLTVSAFVALLSLGVETGVAFLAQLTVWAALSLAYDYPRACRIATGLWCWPSWQWERLLRLAREIGPIGVGHFMNSLLVSMPRMAVERWLGLEALGLLTVVTYFQQAGTLVVNAASQTLVNYFARLKRDGETKAIRTTLLALFGAAVLVSAGSIAVTYFAGEQILANLFGVEFTRANDLLMLIALAISVKVFAMLPQSLMHSDRRFKAYFRYQAASLALCIVLLAILVPLWGLLGAGSAILATAVFRMCVLTVAVAIWPRNSTSKVASPAAPRAA
ncbi:hypothetical protein NKH19_28595 [Mesorhizobium sp. M1338]|uniref:lipopolysaccharide biosynthesis protein n=1 Tax=unclassified Mesorhizobium TaxID=325217 RepID=UPI003338B4F2